MADERGRAAGGRCRTGKRLAALADHLLGYTVSAGPDAGQFRHGPQPYEGILSVVCESFGCAPDVAERQDWPTVRAILDYRTAKAAVEAFDDMEHGRATMTRNPHLMEMLRDMVQALTGADPAAAAAILDGMRAAKAEDDGQGEEG